MYLASPKIKFLDTYLILYSELNYTHSVMGNNQHIKGTGSISSEALKLSSIYKCHYLVVKFSLVF